MAVERYVFTTRTFVCESCDHRDKVLGWGYDPAPNCPKGHGSLTIEHFTNGASAGVIPDDIPGGMEIKHGLCNADGTPRKYYSKSEMKREAYKRGLTNLVDHVPLPGTDKSPFTTKPIGYADFRTDEQRRRSMAEFLGIPYDEYVARFCATA